MTARTPSKGPARPDELHRYTCVKVWSRVPAYADAPFLSRAIADAALAVFMQRGSVPSDPLALCNAIGAGGLKGYDAAYPEARRAIDALLPLWRVELEKSLAFLDSRRDNGSKGGRPIEGWNWPANVTSAPRESTEEPCLDLGLSDSEGGLSKAENAHDIARRATLEAQRRHRRKGRPKETRHPRDTRSLRARVSR